MRLYSQVLKLFLLLGVLSFVSCGYKPTSKFSREVTGEKISTSVSISAQDPENTVIIKDAVDAAIIQIFHAGLTSRSKADTHLNLSISAPTYAPIQYDLNGYVIAYRATIVLGILRETHGERKSYSAKGTYDFSIDPNAVVTDQQRFDAIKFSATKAISSFIAQVAAEGARKNKEE